MAHNAYLVGGAVGAYPVGYVPNSKWFADLDTAQFQAINGDLGGRWDPASTITIGGSYGLTMSAPLIVVGATCSVLGTMAVYGTQVVVGTQTVTGYQDVTGTVTITGSLGVSSTLTVSGTTTLANGLRISYGGADIIGHSTVAGNLWCGALTTGSSATITGTATLSATASIGTTSAPVNVLGRLGVSAAYAALATDTVITAAFPTVYRISDLGGSPRNATFATVGFSSGALQFVRNDDPTYNVTVRDAGVGNLAVLAPGTFGLFYLENTTWTLLVTV